MKPVLVARTAQRFIVPQADAARFFVGHYEKAPAYFTPSVAEVDAFETALPGFLKKAPGGAALAAKIGRYRRHFVGTVIDGKRLVFGNFFCVAFGKRARDVVMVDGGGDCFFKLFYDGATAKFSKLSINHGK